MTRLARLGAFIVVTLAVLASGVFIIGSKEYLFRSTYKLRAQFQNVVGLAEGADVQVGGVHSGTVTAIELPRKPGDEVTVVMELDRTTREIIKRDSMASIETEGLLGNQFLAISFGSAGEPEVRDGETIQSVPPLQMGDMLRKANGILDSSQQAVQNVTMATAHLNSVSTKIDSGQGTVGALVNDKQLYSDLEQTTTTLHATMLQAQTGVTDFQENMEALKHNFLLSGYFKKRGYEDSADLGANAIGGLPEGTPVKAFTFTVKQLFDSRDSAKLKNQKSLKAVGDFLAQNQFGVAVVVASTGMEGDTQKDAVLREFRI
jgi:phospholipid/cholesterol/gamma-HCH transport system substrate-binding protein